MTIAFVLGASADFPPASSLIAGARERGIPTRVISAVIADSDEVEMVEPIDVHVLLGQGSIVVRQGLALMGLEREMLPMNPSAIVVFGATEVAVAAALIAAKQHIPLWHAGAGRWTFETEHPDDIVTAPRNDDLIAVVAQGLLAPTELAGTALAAARYDPTRIWVTGPLEAETLLRTKESLVMPHDLAARGIAPRGYVAASVRSYAMLPGHPLPFVNVSNRPYAERTGLVANAAVAVTDSFELQLEACMLQVPCLVLAPASPISETRAAGAAKRVPNDSTSVAMAVAEQSSRARRAWEIPRMFDEDVSARMLGLIQPVEPRKRQAVIQQR
ncbi:MAG: UDP-N-acetylglucosamine 2-epimerase [Actinomycetota bacterium]